MEVEKQENLEMLCQDILPIKARTELIRERLADQLSQSKID